MNDREHGAKHLRTWAAQVEEMVNSRMDEIEKEERMPGEYYSANVACEVRADIKVRMWRTGMVGVTRGFTFTYPVFSNGKKP